MKKKIFGGLLILLVGFMNVTPVLALAHAVSIVKENDAVKQREKTFFALQIQSGTGMSDRSQSYWRLRIS